jgi:CDP-L-myo-inositol myo-inositolphosphotransferase
MSRRARLVAHYTERDWQLTDDPAAADEIALDCVIPVGEDRMHVCEIGVRAVETALLRSLRKDADGIVSRHLNRYISLAITRRLVNTSIRPNQVTVVIAAFGLASGFVVALGSYWAAVIGALLLNAQSILDGVDGELSRIRRQGSRLGEWLDTVSDDLSNLSFFVGATIAVGPGAIQWFGVAGIALFALTQVAVYVALAVVYRSGNLQSFQWDTGGSWGRLGRLEVILKRDFFCLAFVVLALAGALDVAVAAMAIGALATMVTVAVTTLRRRSARAGPSALPAASPSAPTSASAPPRSRR